MGRPFFVELLVDKLLLTRGFAQVEVLDASGAMVARVRLQLKDRRPF